MPMPDNGTAWPLAGQADHLQDVNEYAAWYAGDPDMLEAQYGGGTPGSITVLPSSNRPSQLAGGIAGRLARWWWGQPTLTGQARTKLHIPLAADIAGASADLLFAEPVTFVTADGDKRMQEFVQGMRDEGLDAQLHEGAEVAAALGDTYLRVRWDKDVSPMPWLDPIQADGAWPEYKHGRLHAITLWSVLPSLGDHQVWRLLERHTFGAIEYALYAGTLSNLGKRQPLPEHPNAEDLAALVNEDGLQVTGAKRLCVSHVPNMLPNRKRRRSHQGRSDLQGVLPILDALDEVYSSWMRDVRLAKARIHVPAQFMEPDGPGQGGSLYLDREVYVPVEGVLPKGDGMGDRFDVQQFAIRTAEHLATAQDLTAQAIRSAGYSLATFGGEGEGGAMTATEVRAKRERSYTTRDKKVRYWTAGLNYAMAAAVEVANHNLAAGLSVEDMPRVQFPDGVQESVLSLANTAQALRNAEAASVQVRVAMVHPDWSEQDVQDEAARIIAENGGPAEPLLDPEDAGL